MDKREKPQFKFSEKYNKDKDIHQNYFCSINKISSQNLTLKSQEDRKP